MQYSFHFLFLIPFTLALILKLVLRNSKRKKTVLNRNFKLKLRSDEMKWNERSNSSLHFILLRLRHVFFVFVLAFWLSLLSQVKINSSAFPLSHRLNLRTRPVTQKLLKLTTFTLPSIHLSDPKGRRDRAFEFDLNRTEPLLCFHSFTIENELNPSAHFNGLNERQTSREYMKLKQHRLFSLIWIG